MAWYRFAQIALELDFKLSHNSQLGSKEKLESSLLEFLLPITEHIIDQKRIVSLVLRLRRSIVARQTTTPNPSEPPLVNDKAELDLRHRCGRPYELSQSEVRRSLHIQWVDSKSKPGGRYITPHYVHCAIFQAFFGKSTESQDEQHLLRGNMLSSADDSMKTCLMPNRRT